MAHRLHADIKKRSQDRSQNRAESVSKSASLNHLMALNITVAHIRLQYSTVLYGMIFVTYAHMQTNSN